MAVAVQLPAHRGHASTLQPISIVLLVPAFDIFFLSLLCATSQALSHHLCPCLVLQAGVGMRRRPLAAVRLSNFLSECLDSLGDSRRRSGSAQLPQR